MSAAEVAPGVVHIRAANPSMFSLSGTNTWIVGSDPCWVIDPGPALDDHIDAILGAVGARGGCGGILLTHDHPDHVEAVPALVKRLAGYADDPFAGDGPSGAPRVAAARYPSDVVLRDGDVFGPLTAIATPGHAPDHLAFLFGDGILFTGDAVLGEGSVFVAPDPGALSAYLDALRALKSRPLTLICPGHGPLVEDPQAKLDEYIAHRLDRERRLLEALDAGARSTDEMLAHAWADVPAHLKPAAAVTLAAHLDKLAEEGRLPDGVERPTVRIPGAV